MLRDPTTRVVALYLETVRDPERFVAALQDARQRQIPVIALKTGLSERGQAMTQAHTGALAGGAAAYAALFARYGVRQVFSLDEMMDTIELFSQFQSLPSPGVATLMESGGERSLLVDIASKVEIGLPQLGAVTTQQLRQILEDGVEPDNPLDAFGSGQDVVATYRDSLLALHDDPQTGLLLLAVDLARDSYLSHDYVEAALAALPQIQKPFAALVNLSAGANVALMGRLRAHGIPVLMGTETGLKAIRHLSKFSESRTSPWPKATYLGRPDGESAAAIRAQLGDTASPLDEFNSKQILAAYGITITQEKIVQSTTAAVAFAETIGFPVVAKTALADILHKSEVHGIHLDLRDAAATQAAYSDLAERLGPDVLVQEMVSDGIELILGMKHDPQFGPLIVVGMGGIFAEIYNDAATVMPPLSQQEAADLPNRLRSQKILTGARGQKALDLDALTDTILRFATFVADCGDLLAEVDLNPIKVSTNGVTVVDALIIPKGL